MRLRLKFPLEALATMRVAYNVRRIVPKFSDCKLGCAIFGVVLVWGFWRFNMGELATFPEFFFWWNFGVLIWDNR